MSIIEDAHEMQARIDLEVRQRRIADEIEQRSSSNAPGFRIRLWEKRHQLALPLSAAHPLIDVIATATDLTRKEVEEEMQKRGIARAQREAEQAAAAK